MLDIGYVTAFAGGTLALLSPCSALLLPSFLAYAVASRTGLIGRTALFGLGLAAMLVPLGVGAGALAALVTEHRALLVAVVGWLVIALGVVQIVGGGWSVRPAAGLAQRMATRGTALSTVGLGAAYGLAGFCSGPILGAVLTVAAAGGQSVRGGALLAVYAAGMTLPLFVLALLWTRFDLGRRRWLRGREFSLGPADRWWSLRLHTTSTISGLLFVAVGLIFLLADGTAALLGADPATALAAENAVVGAGARIPDVVLLAVAAIIVAAVVAWRLRADARARAGTSARSTTPAPPAVPAPATTPAPAPATVTAPGSPPDPPPPASPPPSPRGSAAPR